MTDLILRVNAMVRLGKRATYSVEVARDAGGFVAHNASLTAVHQQGCCATASVPWAALLVHFPVGGASTAG